jgi:quercetin dioxygenase-like cupin family protein
MLTEAQPLALLNALSYQEGAVVSTTLLNKLTGTVTLFAFDQGQGLSEHTAPFDALVQILEGEAEIFIDQQAVQVRAGELLLLPAQVPHALKALSPFTMLLTMIRS